MLVQQNNELRSQCRYCGHGLQIGVSEVGMLPMCEPSVKVGLICVQCGSVNAPQIDEVSFES
jgi:hypothetical protein